jgi:hypothetical protein
MRCRASSRSTASCCALSCSGSSLTAGVARLLTATGLCSACARTPRPRPVRELASGMESAVHLCRYPWWLCGIALYFFVHASTTADSSGCNHLTRLLVAFTFTAAAGCWAAGGWTGTAGCGNGVPAASGPCAGVDDGSAVGSICCESPCKLQEDARPPSGILAPRSRSIGGLLAAHGQTL